MGRTWGAGRGALSWLPWPQRQSQDPTRLFPFKFPPWQTEDEEAAYSISHPGGDQVSSHPPTYLARPSSLAPPFTAVT